MDNNKVEAKSKGKAVEQDRSFMIGNEEQTRLEIAEKLMKLENWLHGCVLDDVK